jgi:hypothetical protein
MTAPTSTTASKKATRRATISSTSAAAPSDFEINEVIDRAASPFRIPTTPKEDLMDMELDDDIPTTITIDEAIDEEVLQLNLQQCVNPAVYSLMVLQLMMSVPTPVMC